MPKFRKEIVTAGTYKQWDKVKEEWYNREVKPEYLHTLKSSFDKMTQKGLKVPAPWKHDLDINAFAIDGPNKDGGFLKDSSINGGFWENLEVEVINGKTKLFGVIDAPGDRDDPNTPAGKISKTVKDTSIYVRDKMPMTNDSNDVIENAIMHIALVTHPIEPGQANFEAINEEDSSYIAMSQYVDNDEQEVEDVQTDAGIAELATVLKKCFKIFLPQSTNIKTLIPNLLASAKQYEMLHEEDQDDISSRIVKVDPIIMNQEQIKALVESKVVNPTTGKPYVNEDFKTAPANSTNSEIIMSALQTQMQTDRRGTFKSRIDNLVTTGRTTKAFADSNLYPKANAYEIKIEDGKVAASPLEEILMSLEALEAKAPVTTDAYGKVVMANPPIDETQYTEEEADKAADMMVTLITG